MKGLMLHSGSAAATLDQVTGVPVPEATESWQPVPHRQVVDLVLDQVRGLGFKVASEAHGLWREGARYFGMFELTNGVNSPDYSLIAGVRNSHDKSFPAAFAIGSRVFVCDNLAFSGEIVIQRRHTRYIERDLPGLVGRAVAKLTEVRNLQEKRIEAYKGYDMPEGDRLVHDLVIRAVDQGVIANQRIPAILGEWRKPRYPEFEPRTAWSLFNSFTEVLKGVSEFELPRRTVRLHGMMDALTGVALAAGDLTGDAEDTEVKVNLN